MICGTRWSLKNGIRKRWHKRFASQFCSQCKYDLRAHETGDRCPECGTRIAGRPLSK
jgi:hypothetical protein